MASKNVGQLWIDGFNLFHRWKETRSLMRGDIARGQEEAVRRLSLALGSMRKNCLVFMDGGPSRESFTFEGLRVRYPGPGLKADELMEETARGRSGKGRFTVVTADRALAACLRRCGARIMDAEDFIRSYLSGSKVESEPTVRKPQNLSEAEVEEWLKVFEEE